MNADRKHNEYYGRQIGLPGIGEAGQKILREARALVIGAGGSGCAASTYLALAGVGNLGILDYGRVEMPNLHRQPLYTPEDLGRPMAEVAAEALSRLVPWLHVSGFVTSLNVDSGLRIAPDFDILLDCTDNITAHRDINQVAVYLKKPFIHSALQGMGVSLTLFTPGSGPCYHCASPSSEERLQGATRETGVLGALAGLVGSLQAAEAVKYLTGMGKTAAGRLIHFDMGMLAFHEEAIQRNPGCQVCSAEAEVAYSGTGVREISMEEFLDRRRGNAITILDVRESDEVQSLRLRDSVSIPLSDLEEHVGTLERNRTIVTVCNAGIKSRSAARFLRQRDFPEVLSLKGRIMTLWKAHPELFES